MRSSQESRPLEVQNEWPLSLTAAPIPEEANMHSLQKSPSTTLVNEAKDETQNYLTGIKLYLIVAGLCISVLLVALVRLVAQDLSVQLLSAC